MSITAQLTNFKPFEAHSFSWGTRHSPSAGMPGAKAQVGDCHLTKSLDDNSGQLSVYAVQGIHIAKGEITFRKEGAPYLVATLSDVYISSYNFSSGGDKPLESLTLNFTKVEYKY